MILLSPGSTGQRPIQDYSHTLVLVLKDRKTHQPDHVHVSGRHEIISEAKFSVSHML